MTVLESLLKRPEDFPGFMDAGVRCCGWFMLALSAASLADRAWGARLEEWLCPSGRFLGLEWFFVYFGTALAAGALPGLLWLRNLRNKRLKESWNVWARLNPWPFIAFPFLIMVPIAAWNIWMPALRFLDLVKYNELMDDLVGAAYGCALLLCHRWVTTRLLFGHSLRGLESI